MMQAWRMRFLGIDSVPGWLSDTEIEQFFTLSPAEIATVRARRADTLQLGLALQIGFLRMTGCAMNSTDVIPRRVLEFLGMQLEIKTPRVTSLRALYARKPTLHEHQHLAQAQLKFHPLTDRAERHLIAYLRRTRGAVTDPTELVVSARQWLYESHCLIVGERYLLDLCRHVISNDEAQLANDLNKRITAAKRKAWVAALMETHSEIAGINRLDWIKRSPRSRRGQALADTFERVQFLRKMGIDTIEFPSIPVALIKTYAARVSRLKLTRVTRLSATTRDIGLPCFLLMSLWRTTDEAIDAWLMRVAEVRRLAMDRSAAKAEIDWQRRHESLVAKVAELADGAGEDLSTRLADLIAQEHAPRQSRAEHARQTLLGMSAHVRRLLRLMVALPIQCQQPDDWLTQAIGQLQQTYAKQQDRLDVSVTLTYLPPLWRRITPRNGGERLRLLEAATLLQLQRSLRIGHVVVLSSLSFRSRDALLIPLARWEERRSTYLKQLGTAGTLGDITKTVIAQMTAGLRTLAQAVRQERVVIDNIGIRAPQWTEVLADTGVEMRLRRAFAQHVGSVELPRLLMEVDSEVRFSAIVLQRSPHSDAELMAVYGAVLAHGMGLDREQVLRMIPTVTDSALHTAMGQLEDEGRLAQANTAIVQFMHRHPVVTAWGDPGLASSDMMTIEASRRLWNARVDPRSGNYAIGTYTHVLDQWGIAHDQPIVLNRRQAGAAIEGVLLQRLMPIHQLAVDTHGYTDVAMGLARLLGFDLCPRLAHLRERKLYVPDGLYVPKPLRSITVGISLRTLREHWESLLRLAASIREGWCSATDALGRLGSDAQGDPLYQAAVSFGRLVRTQYLCKYFADAQFRSAIRRALNHGESVHQLQRTIHPYAIGPKRGRSREEQRAISGSLALLSNAVMAWNTQALQAMVNLPAHKRPDITSADLAAAGPVATGHINFRGVLHFPVEELGEPILRVPVRLGAR